MAGSYYHMTNDDGTPYDERFGEGSMLENGGDIVEALKDCYAIIWTLAEIIANDTAFGTRADILEVIEEAIRARAHGLERGKSGR